MARKNRTVKSLLMYVALGALTGMALAGAVALVYQWLAPPRYEARALLLHAPGKGEIADASQFVRATLARDDFLPDLVDRRNFNPRTAAALAGKLRVVPTAESSHLAELVMSGADGPMLEAAVNAIADDMTALHENARLSADQDRLQRLNAELTATTQHNRELELRQDRTTPLPMWVHGAVVNLANLAKQRFELELSRRYPLEDDDPLALEQHQARIADLVAEERRMRMTVGGNANIPTARFDLELDLAVSSAKILALLQTKQRLLADVALADGPLRVVQSAQIRRLEPRRGPLLALALGAALLGVLGGMGLWSLRRPANGRLAGPVVETDVRVRVIGIMDRALTHYGERKLRPLAQTHPDHLAIAGVHSLSTALHVLAADQDRDGPVVFVEAGPPRHASHVLANLAMVAADRGDRVLLVEAAAGSAALSAMFTAGTRTTLSTSLDSHDLDAATERGRDGQAGRIRFVCADDGERAADDSELPVPGAFINYFDRVYIHARDVAQACFLLDGYGAGIGVLVCGNRQRLAHLRDARTRWLERSPTLHGIVLCGYRVDESAYLP